MPFQTGAPGAEIVRRYTHRLPSIMALAVAGVGLLAGPALADAPDAGEASDAGDLTEAGEASDASLSIPWV